MWVCIKWWKMPFGELQTKPNNLRCLCIPVTLLSVTDSTLPFLPRTWDILLFPPYSCPSWQNWFLMILLPTPDDQQLPRSFYLETVCQLMWNMTGQWCCWKLCTSSRRSLTSIKVIGHHSCTVDFHFSLKLDVSLTDRLPEEELASLIWFIPLPDIVSPWVLLRWKKKKNQSITAASLYFRNSKCVWWKFA